MTREKTYLVSNLYMKFSELQMLEGDDQPFCDIYGATSSSGLMEYLSPEEILVSSEEDLIAFLAEKSRNRIKAVSYTHLCICTVHAEESAGCGRCGERSRDGRICTD